MSGGNGIDTGMPRTAQARPRDHVTGTLARRILSGELPPGARLPTEAEL